MNDERILDAVSKFELGETIDNCREQCGLSRNRMIALLKQLLGLEKYAKIAKETSQRKRKEGSLSARLGVKRGPMPNETRQKISNSHKGKKIPDNIKRQISEKLLKRIETEGFWLSSEKISEKNQKSAKTSKERGSHRKGQHNKPLLGRAHSEEARKKMSDSKRSFLENGGSPSFLGKNHDIDTRKLLSEKTTKMWIDGKFDYAIDGNVWKSKLEVQVFEYLNERYSCKSGFRIDGKIFDILIKDLNVVVEVNGDYWHLNPSIYTFDHFDSHRNVYANEIWKKDNDKSELAQSKGYKIVHLWESDLKTNFEETINNAIQLCRSDRR